MVKKICQCNLCKEINDTSSIYYGTKTNEYKEFDKNDEILFIIYKETKVHIL